MGIFTKVMDTAKQGVMAEAELLVLEGEVIEKTIGVSDVVLITSKRVIFKDITLFKARSVWTSLPFDKINGVSIELGKGLAPGRDAWIHASGKDFEVKLYNQEDSLALQAEILKRIC